MLSFSSLVGIIEMVSLVVMMSLRATIANTDEYVKYVNSNGTSTYSSDVRGVLESCKQLTYFIYLLYFSGMFTFIDYMPYLERVFFAYVVVTVSAIGASWSNTGKSIPLSQYIRNALKFEWFCLKEIYNDVLRLLRIK